MTDRDSPSRRHPRGAASIQAWERFREQLLDPEDHAPKPTATDVDCFSEEVLEALADIAALRDHKLRSEDIDPRVAARWIQLFGLEGLRCALAEDKPDPET
jgi:hypothetical protein